MIYYFLLVFIQQQSGSVTGVCLSPVTEEQGADEPADCQSPPAAPVQPVPVTPDMNRDKRSRRSLFEVS